MSSDSEVSISTPHLQLQVAYQTLEICLSSPTALAVDVGPQSALYSSTGTQVCVEVPGGTQVVLSPTHVLSALVGVQGPAGASGTGLEAVYLPGFDTSAVSAGRFVFVDANYTLAHTDPSALPSASAIGCFDGQWGRVLAFGISEVSFSALSSPPEPGQLVFLASAGQATADCPASGFVAPVGYVVSVPEDFTTTRLASVLVRVQNFARRAS